MVFTFALESVIGRVLLVRTSLTAAVLGLVTLVDDQLARAHMSRWELRQSLREAGHAWYRSFRAVLLEPSGRISAIPHGGHVDPEFLADAANSGRGG